MKSGRTIHILFGMHALQRLVSFTPSEMQASDDCTQKAPLQAIHRIIDSLKHDIGSLKQCSLVNKYWHTISRKWLFTAVVIKSLDFRFDIVHAHSPGLSPGTCHRSRSHSRSHIRMDSRMLRKDAALGPIPTNDVDASSPVDPLLASLLDLHKRHFPHNRLPRHLPLRPSGTTEGVRSLLPNRHGTQSRKPPEQPT